MEPLHITEFASPRFFNKLNQSNEAQTSATEDSGTTATATTATTFEHAQLPHSHTQQQSHLSAFSLPYRHNRPGRRRRSNDTERSGDGPKRRNVQTEKEQFDKTNRKQSFTSSISLGIFKIPKSNSSPSELGIRHGIDASPFFTHEEEEAVVAQKELTFGDRFFGLPNELQLAIVAPLPMPTILNLRLVSRNFHTLISLNESPITRYHLAHSVPYYCMTLYPAPDRTMFTLQYLCGLWHRLHVSSKLADLIATQTRDEWFNRTTPAQIKEFAPHEKRMRTRLQPLLFTAFHFFEKYRELHLKHLQEGKKPLKQHNLPPNPIEEEIMYGYDEQTLLQLHQVFPLIMSTFSRSLRPPSFIGKFERTMKGYFYDKPKDEVYATILLIGGLRQVERFWGIKGYNSRRAEVDRWYTGVTAEPVAAPATKSRFNVLGLGRKKKETEKEDTPIIHDETKCKQWDCVATKCVEKRGQKPVWREDLVFHTSLAAGPPMKPLTRFELKLLLEDQQPWQGPAGIWMQTGERVILERGIATTATIKRNTQVLLELIKEDGASELTEWAPGLSQAPTRDAGIEPTDPVVNGFQGMALRDM